MKGRFAFVAMVLTMLLAVSFLLPACGEGGVKPGETYEVEVYTLSVGSSGYAVGTGIAQFLTEKNSWVKAAVLESVNPTVNAKQVIENPDMRKKLIIIHNGMDQVLHGVPPYDAYDPPYDGLRGIASYSAVTAGWVTNDPKIKEPKDLAGKTVGSSPPTGGPTWAVDALVASGATGIKEAHYDFAGRVSALKDGLVSAAWIAGLVGDVKAMKIMGNPAAAELLSTQPVVNFISYIEGTYDAQRAKYDLSPVEVVVAAGGWGEKQTVPWRAEVIITQFLCDKSMPDEVVYEFTKAMGENVHRLKDFDPGSRAVTTEYMPQMNIELKYMHPGAVKYYKEIGVDQFIGKRWLD